MSVSDLLAVVGLVLGLVGVAIGVYYGRKALVAGRNKLTWSAESIPILSQPVDPYAVEVTIRGHRVYSPHLMRLTVSNPGRLDLDSARFDQGRPLVFRLSRSKFVYVIESGDPVVKADDQSISLGPELLRSRSSWVVSALTEGATTVTLVGNHLIDIEMLRTDASVRYANGRVEHLSTSIGAASAAAGAIVTAASLFKILF